MSPFGPGRLRRPPFCEGTAAPHHACASQPPAHTPPTPQPPQPPHRACAAQPPAHAPPTWRPPQPRHRACAQPLQGPSPASVASGLAVSTAPGAGPAAAPSAFPCPRPPLPPLSGRGGPLRASPGRPHRLAQAAGGIALAVHAGAAGGRRAQPTSGRFGEGRGRGNHGNGARAGRGPGRPPPLPVERSLRDFGVFRELKKR